MLWDDVLREVLERKANEAENLNKTLQFRPLGHNWNVI